MAMASSARWRFENSPCKLDPGDGCLLPSREWFFPNLDLPSTCPHSFRPHRTFFYHNFNCPPPPPRFLFLGSFVRFFLCFFSSAGLARKGGVSLELLFFFKTRPSVRTFGLFSFLQPGDSMAKGEAFPPPLVGFPGPGQGGR